MSVSIVLQVSGWLLKPPNHYFLRCTPMHLSALASLSLRFAQFSASVSWLSGRFRCGRGEGNQDIPSTHHTLCMYSRGTSFRLVPGSKRVCLGCLRLKPPSRVLLQPSMFWSNLIWFLLVTTLQYFAFQVVDPFSRFGNLGSFSCCIFTFLKPSRFRTPL